MANRNVRKRNRQPKDKPEHIIVHLALKIVCPYCLNEIANPNNTCIDHVMPRSRFKDTETVVCCKKCNHEKGALTPKEYTMWKLLRSRTNELSETEQSLFSQLDAIRNGHLR